MVPKNLRIKNVTPMGEKIKVTWNKYLKVSKKFNKYYVVI